MNRDGVLLPDRLVRPVFKVKSYLKHSLEFLLVGQGELISSRDEDTTLLLRSSSDLGTNSKATGKQGSHFSILNMEKERSSTTAVTGRDAVTPKKNRFFIR